MILDLFQRPFLFNEINELRDAYATELFIEKLEFEAKSIESQYDKNALSTTLITLQQAKMRMDYHFCYKEKTIPMLSLFAFGSHMIGILYENDGYRFVELLAPHEDMKHLLASCFRIFNDRIRNKYTVSNLPDNFDVMRILALISKNQIDDIPDVFDNDEKQLLVKSIITKPSILCTISSPKAEIRSIAIDCGKTIISILDHDSVVIKGSFLPMIDQTYRDFLQLYQATTKAAKNNCN